MESAKRLDKSESAITKRFEYEFEYAILPTGSTNGSTALDEQLGGTPGDVSLSHANDAKW